MILELLLCKVNEQDLVQLLQRRIKTRRTQKHNHKIRKVKKLKKIMAGVQKTECNVVGQEQVWKERVKNEHRRTKRWGDDWGMLLDYKNYRKRDFFRGCLDFLAHK